MSTEIPLRCTCGAVQGRCALDGPGFVNRILCHCDDCQAFARWLGRPEDILDPYGGTDVVQVTPSQVTIEVGRDQLRSMRLSARGLLRWFTACCRTPVGNTIATPQVPFVGIPVIFVGGEVGPARDRIQGRFSPQGCPPGVHPKASLGLIARSLGQLARARLAGRHRPTPFFHPTSGEPIVAPEIAS